MTRAFRKIRAYLYRIAYRNPTKHMVIVGVTGTDGKTTTCEMIYQIFKAAHLSTGLISTIGVKMDNDTFDTGLHVSTPSSRELYRILSRMKKKGITHVVLELTSHGLDQERARGIMLYGCVFTNVTQDHFDYHKTFENYIRAKLKIITMVKPGGYVVINRDERNFAKIYEQTRQTTRHLHPVFYTINHVSQTAYTGVNIDKIAEGYHFCVEVKKKQIPISLHMRGTYNIYNALGAVALTSSLGIKRQAIITGMEQMRNVSGRMQIIVSEPFLLVIDFAHTPNGIHHILEYFSMEYPGRRMIVLFGSAGKRDALKRPLMGEMVSQFADMIVLTSDDPRDEGYDTISKEIYGGMNKRKFKINKNLFFIESREEAIAYVIRKLAQPQDIILFLGKGHEQSIAIGDEEYPWDEKRIAMRYLVL